MREKDQSEREARREGHGEGIYMLCILEPYTTNQFLCIDWYVAVSIQIIFILMNGPTCI